MTDRMPTPRQRDFLRALDRLPSPTNVELRALMGVASSNAIADHIRVAVKYGWVTRVPGAARSVLLTDMGRRLSGSVSLYPPKEPAPDADPDCLCDNEVVCNKLLAFTHPGWVPFRFCPWCGDSLI